VYQLLLLGLEDTPVAALLDEQLDLLLRHEAPLGEGFSSEGFQDDIGAECQDAHKEREYAGEAVDRACHYEGEPLWIHERDRLGDELADDEREIRYDDYHKSDGDGLTVIGDDPEGDTPDQRGDDLHRGCTAYRRGHGTHDGHAYLYRCKEPVRVGLELLEYEGAVIAFLYQFADTCLPCSNDRYFRACKEAVEENEDENKDYLKPHMLLAQTP